MLVSQVGKHLKYRGQVREPENFMFFVCFRLVKAPRQVMQH